MPTDAAIARAADFVRGHRDRCASYHDHKESMAYAGITLVAGVMVAPYFLDGWPPFEWGHSTCIFATIGVTAIWVAALIFLRFQLRRRRWAALRVAACERVLAKWATAAPKDEDLLAAPPGPAPVTAKHPWVDWLFPVRGAVLAVKYGDTAETLYPKAFVDALIEQDKIGTDAIHHERLVMTVGWALYFSLLVVTLIGGLAN